MFYSLNHILSKACSGANAEVRENRGRSVSVCDSPTVVRDLSPPAAKPAGKPYKVSQKRYGGYHITGGDDLLIHPDVVSFEWSAAQGLPLSRMMMVVMVMVMTASCHV